MGNIFTKRFDEDDKKEQLFKRLENIKDKNKELLNALIAANKATKAAKNDSNFDCDSNYDIYRGFKKFERMSLSSTYDEINDFYTLSNAYINTHEVATTGTNNGKNRILNNFNQLWNDYFDLYKKITTVQI